MGLDIIAVGTWDARATWRQLLVGRTERLSTPTIQVQADNVTLEPMGYRRNLVVFTTLAIIACLPCCWASGDSGDEDQAGTPEADPTVLAFWITSSRGTMGETQLQLLFGDGVTGYSSYSASRYTVPNACIKC